MPPRYAYWTILIDEQPTAFRAADRDDLQPTFKRLQQKHPSARMVWFQNGRIWVSRLEAQEAMRLRGQRGRAGDFRQRQEQRPGGKLEWKPKPQVAERPKLEWKPKSTSSPAEGRPIRRSAKREGGKLEWKPKTQDPRPKTQDPRPRTQDPRPRTWRPGGEHRDPRQKYKDAKKAKWTRFKQTIRKRWETKQGRKKKDEE